MKDHEFAKLVSEVTKVAIEYHNHQSLRERIAKLLREKMSQPPEQSPFDTLKELIKQDPGYAWAWHCNIAMPMYDTGLVNHAIANHCAAAVMRFMFNVEPAHEIPQPASVPDEFVLIRADLKKRLLKDARLAEVAMCFVDRAGDTCEEDTAETICREFNAAMKTALRDNEKEPLMIYALEAQSPEQKK